ncbi:MULTISPECIES: pilin N-terminal domain-containing protein [Leuconostoc gelidum group]|uniref:Uncharacterized protein n=1 Tax=Leuconostoc gelidum subsp. gelidum TaxID=1607839 RepID=A0AB35G2A2_LEUGE|nr:MULTISPECIES: SpaA isopeptide-forming pilin-related protein [Leuconostoc gelidum group]MBZ5960313.1 hypothetical protein [Leuconostoc gasicomitatum]MBZ5968817.1 hypothetical protein [Leuconostoc gasicomitatum]MBZ6016785.1 hypothetical protein [Leuconostoc gelidum subsp. gelidum]
MTKKMMISLIAIVSAVLFSFSLSHKNVEADLSNPVTIKLNHQLSVYGSDPMAYMPGANVTFNLYDLTDDYQKHQNDENYFQTLKSLNQGIEKYIKQNNVQLIETEKTNENGQAIFHADRSIGKAYLIVQEQVKHFDNNGLVYEQMTDPIAFVPADQKMSQDILTIDTKSAIVKRVPYFFKYGRTLDQKETLLAGVKFVFYRLNGSRREYLTNDNNWQIVTDPLHDSVIKKIVSDENGLVALNDTKLVAGEYYFQEVATLKNFEISKLAQQIKVHIPAVNSVDDVLPITVNGQPLSKVSAGVMPNYVMKNAQPRILNYQKRPTVLPFLPATGVAIGSVSIIGLMMVMLVLYLKQRDRKKKGDYK